MSYTPTTVEFFTSVPPGPPEVKGSTCYFNPTTFKWRVSQASVHLTAMGPASRVKHRQGDAGYFLEGVLWSSEVPEWVPIPWDLIELAKQTVRTIDVSRAQHLKEEA